MATASGSLSSGGIVVPPASGWGDSGVTSTLNPDGSVSWCCTTWIVPLPVAAGDVLGAVSIPVRDNGPDNGFSTGGNNVVVMVGTPSADGSTFNVLQFTTTSGAGDLATMVLTFATPHTVAAGENLQIRLRAQTPGIFGPTPATHVSWMGLATARAPLVVRARALSGLTVVPEWPSQAGGPGATRIGSTWTFASQNFMYFPITMNVGETIAGYHVYVYKGSSSAFQVSTTLIEVDGASGAQTVIGSAANQASAPGRLLLGAQSLARAVSPGVTYLIRIADGSGSSASNADSFTDAEILLD